MNYRHMLFIKKSTKKMAKLTETQRYEVGMGMYRAEQALVRQLETAKVGDTINVEIQIKARVGEIEVNNVEQTWKLKEA